MAEARIIKRYANRKLYDTQHSRYVTLEQISEMIRAGDDVKIIDNKSKEDLTSVTLAQIIFEEEKKRSFMPLTAMRNIIQSGGGWFAEAQRRVTSVLKRGDAGAAGTPGTGEADPPDDDAPPADEGAESEGSPRRREGLVVIRELRHWVADQQRALDEWQRRMDGRIRSAIEGISPFAGVHKDMKALAERINELEAKLQELSEAEGGDGKRG
ncbi:MAG TPA: polyhydroxyalkanoate synthesis regulator DNA-binding domain-containing protein [Kofleriaceae bacterium]|nr:polyhydroxyalkanoate synthesis regulator DNA-binding domain-containing protein [Kofleriaceae bacterium]